MAIWDFLRKKKFNNGYFDFNDLQIKNRRQWTDAELIADVKYALQIGSSFVRWLPLGSECLKGKVVLEIGPGLNFGGALFLTCFGARAMVVDPYLAPWDKEYHPRFYQLMRDTLLHEFPQMDVTPINHILSVGGYDPEIITPVRTALEDLKGIKNASVDYIFSNAVFEHLYSPPRAFKSIARITKKGGMGFHQIDFRDHRTMDTPLEFLLLEDDAFSKLGAACHFECGNRWRPDEYKVLFETTGFKVNRIDEGLLADNEYLKTFTSRLRAAEGSKYQHYNERNLSVIGAFFEVQKIQ